MMRKRKTHIETSLIIPEISYVMDVDGKPVISVDNFKQCIKIVKLPQHIGTDRTADFSKFYGAGIDEITYVCQRQIERFLARQDAEIEIITVSGYTKSLLKAFLPYSVLRAQALKRSLTLTDINRDFIDGFLQHLRDSELGRTSQKTLYAFTKAVLQTLSRKKLISIVTQGDDRTFPKNPFPNINRQHKGATPLTKKERKAFIAAVKTEVAPLFKKNVTVTSELLTYALLVVALHTGRNTTPLLEMTPDCLRSHPKENFQFLVLWKRRGRNTSKIVLRDNGDKNRVIESLPGIKIPVVRLIRRVIELAEPLQSHASRDMENRIWLYRSCNKRNHGVVTTLTETVLLKNIRKLVSKAALVDSAGNPLNITISRLRKTFANRLFELLDGDLGTTAIALGNTPQVAGRNYMAPNDNSQRNWKFMGEVLTQELLNNTLGTSERTPSGHCTDSEHGQYAPKKKDGTKCLSFLECLRCRNYVVTGDDLYKIFSFYWRVLRERGRMDKRIWEKYYAHIPRLIERDVIEAGVQKRVFTLAQVQANKERARITPHPFWSYDSLGELEIFRNTKGVA